MGNSFFKEGKAYGQKINKEKLDDLHFEEGKLFSGDLKQDINHIKRLYSYPTNIDFMLREFTIHMMEKKAALFYIPSLTDVKLVDEEIIRSLITMNQVVQDVPSSISASAISEE